MSQSGTEQPADIKSWTEEDVYRWLMTEVKVHHSCADKFIEEEVSGQCLDDYEKKDLLELGIKHGPAVKITSYLERLKTGSQHESLFESDVENWTKEEVTDWLLKTVKVKRKKAERFEEEDVSGDCLVCFKKQDFLDLELKKGPAVKILKELDRLKPATPHNSMKMRRTQDKNKTYVQVEKEDQQPTSQETKRNESAVDPTILINNTLEHLSKDDLKSFIFRLKHFKNSKHKPIPQGKLESTEITEIATLMTEYYTCDEALGVTIDILKKMKKRKLASQLQRDMDQGKLCPKYSETRDTEDSLDALETEDITKAVLSSRSRFKQRWGKCRKEKSEEDNPRFMKINFTCCPLTCCPLT